MAHDGSSSRNAEEAGASDDAAVPSLTVHVSPPPDETAAPSPQVNHPEQDSTPSLTRPAAAVLGQSQARRHAHDDLREASELQEQGPSTASAATAASASVSAQDLVSSASDRRRSWSPTASSPNTAAARKDSTWQVWRRTWARQISVVTRSEDNRDHFANERTYLAYLRTSSAIAVFGVLVAQLFRLRTQVEDTGPPPPGTFDFFYLAIPVASACIGCAMLVMLMGGYRFWRQQNAMLRGKCHAGGWELYSVAMVMLIILLLAFFVSVLISSQARPD